MLSLVVWATIIHRSAQSYLTRAGDRSKHPALSISDRQTLLFVPGAQNLHAAPPGHRIGASLIVTGPSPQQHTSIVITIDLIWEESTQVHRLIPMIKNSCLFFRKSQQRRHDHTCEVWELPWHWALWKHTQGSFFLNGLCQGSSDILDSYPGFSDKHPGFHFQTTKYKRKRWTGLALIVKVHVLSHLFGALFIK